MDGWEVHLRTGCERSTVYARNVVLATGAFQQLPLLQNPSHTSKLVCSDSVVSSQGFLQLSQQLTDMLTTSPRPLRLKVAIIGGSHSGFSAAWMFLHRFQSAFDVCHAANHANNTTLLGSIPNDPNKVSPQKKPFRGHSSGVSSAAAAVELTVVLLHRSPIKVFYETRAEADRDGYHCQAADEDEPGGRIHNFGGLRGDAKVRVRVFK